MVEKKEPMRNPPEPKVMESAIVYRENAQGVAPANIRQLEPKVMNSAINPIQKAKREKN
jgi:hypothetical protein